MTRCPFHGWSWRLCKIKFDFVYLLEFLKKILLLKLQELSYLQSFENTRFCGLPRFGLFALRIEFDSLGRDELSRRHRPFLLNDPDDLVRLRHARFLSWKVKSIFISSFGKKIPYLEIFNFTVLDLYCFFITKLSKKSSIHKIYFS